MKSRALHAICVTLREDMDYDGEEAERVESRLDLLRRLNRKYGASTQDMLRYQDKIEAELGELEDSDEAAEKLEKEYRQQTHILEEISMKLTHAREEAARRFEKAIVEQLRELGMKNARLSMACAAGRGRENSGSIQRTWNGSHRNDVLRQFGTASEALGARSFRRRIVTHHVGTQESFPRKSQAFREAWYLMKLIPASADVWHRLLRKR